MRFVICLSPAGGKWLHRIPLCSTFSLSLNPATPHPHLPPTMSPSLPPSSPMEAIPGGIQSAPIVGRWLPRGAGIEAPPPAPPPPPPRGGAWRRGGPPAPPRKLESGVRLLWLSGGGGGGGDWGSVNIWPWNRWRWHRSWRGSCFTTGRSVETATVARLSGMEVEAPSAALEDG